MNRPLRLLLCSAIAAALPLPALADPLPNALRFSVGVSRAGQPFTGAIDIELQFFTAQTGGVPTIAPLVIEDVPVQGGVGFFTADFGAENPLNDEDTWIGGGIRLGESSGAFSAFSRRSQFLPGAFALHAQKVAGGAIGLVQIRSDEVQRRIGGGCSASAAIRQINQDGSVVCETVSGGSGGGSIAGVTAGTGLSGGGSAGVVELSVAAGGIGPTQLASGAVTVGKIAGNALGSAEVVDASIKAVDIDSAEIQRRVAGSCAVGSAIRSVGEAGEIACETVAGGAGQAWQLDGNAASSGQFIGTTNALPFEMRVNGERGLRLESLNDPDGGSYGGGLQTVAVVAGSSANQAIAPGALVAGGGAPDFSNTASGKYASVLGGLSNAATGDFSVALGQRSLAGADSSFAAGNQANVRQPSIDSGPEGDIGTFIWADSQNTPFQSTGQNQFLIRAAGGVGVNTNAPMAPLHVNSVAVPDGLSLPAFTTALFSSSGVPTNMVFASTVGQPMVLHFLSDQSGRIAFNGGNTPGGFEFSVADSSAQPLRLLSDGDVSIGRADDAGAVTVRGNTQVRGDLTVTGTLSASNCCSVPSDLRLKQAIEPISSPLSRLLGLHGYRFEYSDEAVAAYDLPDAPQLGFIAQELGDAFPEWRVEDRRGFQSVLLRGFDALLVEALREMAESDAREDIEVSKRVQALEAENRRLRERLDRLEAGLLR
jgi:hypothetical protein